MLFPFFFFNDPATTEIYTLSHTTLFRSTTAPNYCSAPVDPGCPTPAWVGGSVIPAGFSDAPGCQSRSEEHTSELQSRLHLVCRLLLEKKKKKKKSEEYSVKQRRHTRANR